LSEIATLRQTSESLKNDLEYLKKKYEQLNEEKQNKKIEQTNEITQKRKEIFEELEKSKKKDSKMPKFDFNKEFAHHKKVMDRLNQDLETLKESITLQENKLKNYRKNT